SSDHRNADKVLPDPVGATTRVLRPPEIASHAPVCAGVGPSGKASSNQARVAGPKRSRGLATLLIRPVSHRPRTFSGATPWLGSRILGPMRLTLFWQNMHEQFGEAYADSLAQDYVIEGLGSRTVNQALADGWGAKE